MEDGEIVNIAGYRFVDLEDRDEPVSYTHLTLPTKA